MKKRVALLVVAFLAGCTTPANPPVVMDKEKAALSLRPTAFTDLPQWGADRQGEALAAFMKSCRTLYRKVATDAAPLGGTYDAWHMPCRAAFSMNTVNDVTARGFFEQYFQPWQATGDGDPDGLFTGYYEATLNGSRTRHGAYQYPLRAKPDDLVMVDLGDFRPELKGQRIAGRVLSGKLKPYEDNRAISEGKLPASSDRPIVWVDDEIAAAFLQIQGSGVVHLDDGTLMKVGYAGQNGYPYYAFGRELVKRGELAKEDVSMQSIRAWLKAHPDQAHDILFSNKSYVFFQDMGNVGADEGPKGAEGVALTPGRSMAVDHGRISYGVPVYVAAGNDGKGQALRRLLVAQDTGGAIRGPVRGDVFWGRGLEAESRAGVMKAKGRMWLLLPKGATPAPR